MRRLSEQMRRLPTLTPRQYERVTLVALVLVFLIILTGAGVRLTGSGLGCTNWPRCGDSIVAPLEFNAWIEFGNRLITGLVGLPCLAAFFLSLRRTPRRRDLTVISALLPLGVLGQAILGGLTVLFHLRWGFVMGHFLLSQLILASAVALYWRARTEPDTRPAHDRRVVWATRALLVWGALTLVAGTFATAAGPHPGSAGTGEIVPRLTWLGLDELIHWHGRTGTVLGLLALGAWFLARRTGASAELRTALTALCLLVAAQGVIGFAQYELELPAGLVWLHVAVASGAWLSILLANAAAGRPFVNAVSAEHPQFLGDDGHTSAERVSAGRS
jgi:cytochrome c oxidase assembly protein subunit 15